MIILENFVNFVATTRNHPKNTSQTPIIITLTKIRHIFNPILSKIIHSQSKKRLGQLTKNHTFFSYTTHFCIFVLTCLYTHWSMYVIKRTQPFKCVDEYFTNWSLLIMCTYHFSQTSSCLRDPAKCIF